MEIVYLTMFVTVVIAAIFLYLFFINVKKGQYDDLTSPAVRMLFDDDLVDIEDVKTEADKDNVKSTIKSN